MANRCARSKCSRVAIGLALLALAGGVALSGDGPAVHAAGGVIERVGSGGPYGGIALSADGRFIAFTGGGVDKSIFIHDRKTTSTEAIGAASWSNTGLAVSSDGRYVAFSSHEPLVPEDTQNCNPPGCPDVDVYVFDRVLGTFELISVASDAAQGNSQSGWYDDIAISSDGRYVAFVSLASNLVPDDTNTCFEGRSCLDVFVRDRLLDTTKRVSVAGDGTEGNSHSGEIGVSMSADGRFVAFDSLATNLAPDDGTGGLNVFVRDRDADEDGVYDEPGAVETVLVSENGGLWPDISDDGRFVAYHYTGPSLIESVALHDRQSGATTIIGALGAGGTAVDLSGDGRYLAFATSLPLVLEDTNKQLDVYFYDQLTNSFELISLAQNGALGNADSAWGFLLERLAVIALTPDGLYAAFHSYATNFAAGEVPAVFVAATSLVDEVDTDGDGCTDKRELGPQASQGGQRNPKNFWDFFDTPDLTNVRDEAVTLGDIFAVAGRFGASGDPGDDPLAGPIPPAPGYHTAFDRGDQVGDNSWNRAPADGTITTMDIFAVAAQFGHSCA